MIDRPSFTVTRCVRSARSTQTILVQTRFEIKEPSRYETRAGASFLLYTQLVSGPATETKSDRSQFIFRPVPCKRMKRNVWRLIRTHTGLSSSRSHINTPLDYVVSLPFFELLLWMNLNKIRKTERSFFENLFDNRSVSVLKWNSHYNSSVMRP